MLEADSELVIDEIQGDCLEIQLEITPIDARQVGLMVRCSPDGSEQTSIFYDAAAKVFILDDSKASLIEEEPPRDPRLSPADLLIRTQAAPFELSSGEPLKMRIFLDRSIVEVFVNGRQSVTQRIYPSRSDSMGIRIFSRGGRTKVTYIEAWDMAAAGG